MNVRGSTPLTRSRRGSVHGKAESVLRAQKNGRVLRYDPSGFLLIAQLVEEYRDSSASFLREGQLGREQALEDYKAMYLVGAKAKLGPMPKEPTSSS